MPRSAAVATDNFNRASLGTTDWDQLHPFWGTVKIYNSVEVWADAGDDANRSAARWIGAGSFTADQWASIKVANLPWQGIGYNIGVCCRASADEDDFRDWYEVVVCGDTSGPNYTVKLGKVVNNTYTSLHSAQMAFAVNDRIELEVTGTNPVIITACKNGTPIGGSFTYSDSAADRLTSGSVGVCGGGGGGSDSVRGDDWEAGNMIASTLVSPLAGKFGALLQGKL